MDSEFNTDLSPGEAKALALLCFEDPVAFCKIILGHWFKTEIPWVHRGQLAILCRKTKFLSKYGELEEIYDHFVWQADPDDPECPKVHLFEWNAEGGLDLNLTKFTLLMLPRGFSKTTVCNAAELWDCAYNVFGFTVYISEAQLHAETQLANIRRELEGNTRFIALYGNQKPDQRAGKKWAGDTLHLNNGKLLVARGRGSQVRGLLIDGRRPKRLQLDDVEDKESVATAEQRDKTVDWFYGDVTPALPAEDEEAGIVVCGTLLNSEALLAKLRKDPEFNTVVFGCTYKNRTGDEVPLWPYKMSPVVIDRTKHRFTRAGKLNLFYLEYYNKVRNEEGAKFQSKHIIIPTNFDPTEFPFRGLACDPAISGKADADYFALACVGMSEKGRIAVLDAFGERGVHPRRQIDLFFEWNERWKPNKRGVEAIAYQQALVHLLREEMFRRHAYFELEEIRHGNTGKIPRVEGILAPRYAAGYIVHARHFTLLESQLLDWPNGKLDLPDVVAMAISLLDPYAALAADPGRDLADDEYEPLERVVGSDFYSAP